MEPNFVPIRSEEENEISVGAITPSLGRLSVDNINDTTYRKVFVGGLAWWTNRNGLEASFSSYGEVEDAYVIYDRVTLRSKGFGFVTFRDAAAAKRCCLNAKVVVEGKECNVNLACRALIQHSPPAYVARPIVAGNGAGQDDVAASSPNEQMSSGMIRSIEKFVEGQRRP